MFRIDLQKSTLLLLFSIPNTLLNIGLLYIINTFLTSNIQNVPNYLITVFFCLLIYSYLLNISFQGRLVQYSFSLVYDSEVRILKILHDTPLTKLDKYGPNRFYSILEDLRTFIFLPGVLNSVINSILTILICLSYLWWISASATAILATFIFLIAGLYVILNRRWYKKHEMVRQLNEDYYRYIDDSIKGFKELKISKVRTENFFNRFLFPNRMAAKQADIQITRRYLVINLISQYGIYVLLGCVLYFLANFKILDQKQTITYAVALLFLNGPMNVLVSMQNFYSRAIVANKRVKNFFKDFANKDISIAVEPQKSCEYETLSFSNISFKYDTEQTTEFALKDINLKIQKGEVIFIVGGNGSGKSTFINILTGLHQPTQGQIWLNNSIADNSGSYYKDLFSVVYTDNHLFSKNYENYKLEGNPYYQQLLKIMEMDKVIVDDQENSARRKFSKGQSKRMSMIFALLENKPILILDEWAADQDPYFRKYFYENLVPQLRQDGKTIVAVTHDDAYFKYADRIIKFDYGQIVNEINVKETLFSNLL